MRRSNFRLRVWLPATREVGVEGLRFHDRRHTAATLAAASGASLRALVSRIGHALAAAAIRYQHVIDGQDADIVDYLERFDRTPPEPFRDRHATSVPDLSRPARARSWRARRRLDPQRQTGRNALTWADLVETMGLEPTTPCLQMTINPTPDLHGKRESPAQDRFPLSAMNRP